MRRVYLGPQLGRDIDRAADFYETTSAELAMRFLAAVGDSVRLLRAHPYIGSPLQGIRLDRAGIRTLITHAFPYMLFYTEIQERLILVRLLHMSRDIPAAFLRR